MQATTIELTDKFWKKMKIWSFVSAVFGIASCSGGAESSLVATMIFWILAFAIYLTASIGSWWNHS